MMPGDPPFDLAPGKILGHFQVGELIGSGGMGVVFKARDLRLERNVALKVLSPEFLENEVARKRFLREGQLAASIVHPNIATIYEIDEENGALFIAMELVPGRTLKDMIHEGPLSLDRVLAVARQSCDALAAAHRRGVIHRDVKSSNIMVTPEGQVKVLDFGLAKVRAIEDEELSASVGTPVRVHLESGETESGHAVGTPSYMSPEQASGSVLDERSDLFSLGIVLYEASSGALPFRGTSQREVLDAILKKEPPPVHELREQVPDDFSQVLARCLAKRPEDRYSSAVELRKDLDRLGKKKWAPWALAGVATLAAVGVALTVFLGSEHRSQSVAVLPLVDSRADTSAGVMGVLVTDALIAGIQSLPGVATPPWETVQPFRESPDISAKRIVELCDLLAVQTLALGSVVIEGDQIVIRLRLSSRDGTTLWESRTQGPVSQPLQAVEAMKAAVALELEGGRGGRAPPLAVLRTPSEPAYEKYLEAKIHYESWDLEEELDRAVTSFREAVRIDPNFGAAQAGLARALVTLFYQNNDPALVAEATDAVERARALAPDLPEVLLASGFVYEVTGETTQAEEAFARAISLAPGYDTAYRVAASFYADRGLHDMAESLYQRALALRPGSWRIHYDVGRYQLVFRGDMDEARGHMERAESLHPTGDGPKQVLGLIALNHGRLDDAEARFHSVLELSPEDTMARYNLGWVDYFRGRFEPALGSFREAVDRAPDQPMYAAAVGDALRQLGDDAQSMVHYGKAVDLYRRVLEDHPSDDEARAQLASLLATLAQCAEAQSKIDGILSRSPSSFTFTTQGAYVYERCGNTGESERLALRSIAAGDVSSIQFDPDLGRLRDAPEVRQALERRIAALAIPSAGTPRREP
jgi:eukaryotic-like serine/threonine-protein kinase